MRDIIILKVGDNMKKPKIYLDTSLISHLEAPDTVDKMKETLRFWQNIMNGEFEVVLSNVTLEELSKCDEPKLSIMLEFLSRIDYIIQTETGESLQLASEYLKYGVLKEKSRDDLRHIALAVVCKCDYIISWNFKHFVNIRTINKVQAINKLLGYSEINILPPSMFLGDEIDE